MAEITVGQRWDTKLNLDANKDVLLELLNSRFNITDEISKIHWKLASLIRWNREVFNDPYFPLDGSPNLSFIFRLQFRISSLEFGEIFYIPNI